MSKSVEGNKDTNVSNILEKIWVKGLRDLFI